jgi:hypothetical protein
MAQINIRQTKEMLKGLLDEVVGSDASVDAIDFSLSPKPGVIASGVFVTLTRDPGDAPTTPPGAGVYRYQITEDNAVEFRPFVADQDIEFGEEYDDQTTLTLPPEYAEMVEQLESERAWLQEEMRRRERAAHSRSVEDLLDRRKTEGRIPPSLQRPLTVSFSESRESYDLESFLNSLEEDQLAFFSEWSGSLPSVESVHPELFGDELTPTDFSEAARDPIAAAYKEAEEMYTNSWRNGDQDDY